MFIMQYVCGQCNHIWYDMWDSIVDSECEKCGDGPYPAMDHRKIEITVEVK